MMRRASTLLALLAAAAAPAATPRAEERRSVPRAVTDPGVITTRQSITPAGVQSVFNGRVYGLAFAGSAAELAVVTQNKPPATADLTRIDWVRNRVLGRVSLAGNAGLQSLAFDPVSKSLYVAGTRPGKDSDSGTVARLMAVVQGKLGLVADNLGAYNAGALALAPRRDASGRRLLLLPLIHDNRVAVLDLESNRVVGAIEVPVAPFCAVLAADSSYAYVSNWGGRPPRPGERSAPAGPRRGADPVVIDARGILASGAVARLDLRALAVERTIEAGLHPTAMVLDEARNRLYVANSNDDTVSVIDTRSDRVAATWALEPLARPIFGIAPTALALSPDGATLYAACGGINAVAVLDAATGRQRGSIPTAWYPNGLAVSPDGAYLAVSTLLGVGSGWEENPKRRYVHAYRGTVQVVPIPDAGQLEHYSRAVAENNRLPALPEPPPAAAAPPRAVPVRPGEPSPIEHVVYVIKENRTYDQLFGDLERGNGDPSMVMFGRGVADNHRKLALDFVLLDNFYASGGNSGDGHQWATQANETAYVLWPAYQGRSYPFDGTDPIAYSRSGFIWDAALGKGKTVAVYGEFAPRLASPAPRERRELLEQWSRGRDFSKTWRASSPIPGLQKVLAPNFPTYSKAIPDVIRADLFRADLEAWTAAGRMPNLVILQLPSDHTFGTDPDVSTPSAMVADNDLALGRIVEALSRSPFWKKMAIFVVEDDAQNGVDHVDGHRTVALAIGPYVRRGHVDSTFYAHPSMLKTIELILGLEPMTLFDRIANDMRASFVDAADFTPYAAVTPKQDLFERNPKLAAQRGRARAAAAASSRMRWDVPDAVPSDALNRILWHTVKGWNVPFPGVRQSVFAPLSFDEEDERREARRD